MNKTVDIFVAVDSYESVIILNLRRTTIPIPTGIAVIRNMVSPRDIRLSGGASDPMKSFNKKPEIKRRGTIDIMLTTAIYDIDKENSLDVEAILESSSRQFTPIVLQSSFNALGQKEIQGELTNFGYLKIENGPYELVDACIKSNFKNILINIVQ